MIHRLFVSAVFLALLTRASVEAACDLQFNDVASRTLMSTLVFEGRLTATQDDDHRISNATFITTRMLKGDVTSRTISMIINCSFHAEVGATYVVFAVDASNGWSQLEATGLYGVVGPPLLSSRRIVRQVNEYACADCNGEQPRVTLRPRGASVSVAVNRRVRLQCRGQGRPPPHYVWTKDDISLQPSRHLDIKQLKHGSRLQVQRATEEDSGVYKCQAINVVGNSSVKAIQLNVGQAQSDPHSQLCATESCLNGGTCYIMVSIQRQYCQCPAMYIGNRCEEKVIDTPFPQRVEEENERRLRSPSVVILMVLLSAILLSVFTAIVISITCLLRNRYKKSEAARMSREMRKLIGNGSSRSNAARISQYRSNVHSNIIDIDVDTTPAAEVYDRNNNSGQPVGHIHEASNHMDIIPPQVS